MADKEKKRGEDGNKKIRISEEFLDAILVRPVDQRRRHLTVKFYSRRYIT